MCCSHEMQLLSLFLQRNKSSTAEVIVSVTQITLVAWTVAGLVRLVASSTDDGVVDSTRQDVLELIRDSQ